MSATLIALFSLILCFELQDPIFPMLNMKSRQSWPNWGFLTWVEQFVMVMLLFVPCPCLLRVGAKLQSFHKALACLAPCWLLLESLSPLIPQTVWEEEPEAKGKSPVPSVHLSTLLSRQEHWIELIPFSMASSRTRNWTQVSCIAGRVLTIELPGEPTGPPPRPIF